MKIQKLHLHNFKKFSEYTFQFHPHFTVLIGDNATGKTSILDALSIMLSTYVLRFNVNSGRPGMKKEEVRVKIFETEDIVTVEPQTGAFVAAEAILHNTIVVWKRKPYDRTGAAKELTAIAEQDDAARRKGDDVDLPVLLYYGTGRLWDAHRKVPVGKPDSRVVGYRNCLDPRSDQDLFEKWFKQLELSALQKKKTIGVLESVRGVVRKCIPGAQNFSFDVAHDALMIEFQNGEYRLFNTMSDGFRNMVAMVADIAHRAARLNPHHGAEAARKATGTVLIDEIDLHLHPKWQRRVVDDLKAAFPNIQFIATTHSPFIIQSLSPGELLDLATVDEKRDPPMEYTGMAWPGPGNEYSNRSTEDIVEEIMEVKIPQRSKRYQEMYETAKQYYAILQESSFAELPKKERLKKKLDELSAPFSDNVGYHAFLEMERLAAGLGHTTPPFGSGVIGSGLGGEEKKQQEGE